MAKVTQVVVIDDFTGEPVPDGQPVRSVDLSLDGLTYELDLGPTSYEKLMRELKLFIDGIEPVKAAKRGKRPAGTAPAKTDREQTKAKRKFWYDAFEAKMKLPNGGEIPDPSDRGRIPVSVEELYEATGGMVAVDSGSSHTASHTTKTPKKSSSNSNTALDAELRKTARDWAKKQGVKLPRTSTPQWVFDAYEAQDPALLQGV